MKRRPKNIRNDPKVKRAKKLLLKALADQQASIKDVIPHRKNANYAKLIKKCSTLRGGNLFFPYLSSGVGRGALVKLADGSVKYDFITGIGVHYMGHNHPKIVEACIDAALEDTVMHGNLQQGHRTVELLDLFVKTACKHGAKIKNCFLTSSGAMANENAFKMIFQKSKGAKRFLAFERCFSGRSMVMAQVTDKAANRVGLPKVMNIDYVPFYDAGDVEGSTKRAVATLKRHIKKHPKQHAGMIFELIQGEGGYFAGEHKFFMELIKVLKKHKIAVMIDEIQTFGRTEKPFAFQTFKLDKYVDVITVGKSTQVCATFFTDQYKPQPGLISQTFTSSSSAIESAIVILKTLSKNGFLGKKGKIVKMGDYFRQKLINLSKKYPLYINGPFGFQAMVAMTVFDGSKEKSVEFMRKLYDNGVLSFIAGRTPVRVRFLMPILVVTKKDINAVIKIIEKTLIEVGES